ncbi:NADP-binding protein [Dacryopinax primogenitus]|uniref:NADP-binding protein n=1 Tax=Dacryopinax primogenitus (strain DJM 731) TaxID=1858805 RepID=M5FS74_DACPD|nr:NADP-binding protein [Dacryopinax primogenitus]EJT98653.1 NADP-binding protein [Dacryopinax primogenitus]
MFRHPIRVNLPRSAVSVLKRGAHDLLTYSNRPPALRKGIEGRSAISGHTITVFGASGFLGRYIVSKLAKSGSSVVIPYRDDYDIRHLRVSGDLGAVVQLEWDLRNEQQIAECLRHSDTVYNLVGLDYETKNFKWKDVHVDGAARIARIARENNVARFVQVSHLNASPTSTSHYYRAKYEGEQAVLGEFPDAVIVRPSAMYGHEDRFLNQLGFWDMTFKFNGEQTKVRPVHVIDVAEILYRMLDMPVLPSNPVNLPGPTTYTHEELLNLARRVTDNPYRSIAIPKSIAKFTSNILQYAIWWPWFSPDEIERRCIDELDVEGDWDKFGITPTELEDVAIAYLRRFRDATKIDYNSPLETAKAKRRQNAYYSEPSESS